MKTKHQPMTEQATKLLVIEPDPDVQASLVHSFTSAGYRAVGLSDISNAADFIEKYRPHVLIFDPTATRNHLNAILSAVASRRPGYPLRAFALCQLPYNQFCERAAKLPNVKVITQPMSIASIITAVRIQLSHMPSAINYENGMNQIMQNAVMKILGAYLSSNFINEGCFIKKSTEVEGQVLAFIPLSGEKFLASIAVCFDREFSLAVARGMIGDHSGQVKISDSEILEVASEMANQIAGALQEQMQISGFAANIGMPRVVAGENLRIIHPGRNLVVKVQLKLRPKSGIGFLLNRFRSDRVSVEFCFDNVA